MFSKCSVTDPCAAHLDFDLWEITGRWVSLSGAPAVTVYRNTSRKGGGAYALSLLTTTRRRSAIVRCIVCSGSTTSSCTSASGWLMTASGRC